MNSQNRLSSKGVGLIVRLIARFGGGEKTEINKLDAVVYWKHDGYFRSNSEPGHV